MVIIHQLRYRVTTTELLLQSTELLLQSTELLLQSTELLLQSTELLLQSTELLLQSTELLPTITIEYWVVEETEGTCWTGATELRSTTSSTELREVRSATWTKASCRYSAICLYTSPGTNYSRLQKHMLTWNRFEISCISWM